MARPHLLEVWSRDNAARVARAVAPLSLLRQRVLLGEETLEASLPLDDPSFIDLPTGAVLRVHRRGDASELTAWRLSAPVRRIGEDGARTGLLRADALWLDLRHGLVRQRQADGRVFAEFGLVDLSPEKWIADVILPSYDGDAIGFQLGIVEPTELVPLDFSRTSPLEALRMLEERTQCEAQFRLHSSGAYYLVDLLARVGNAEGGAEFRYRKNIRGAELVTDESEIATRLYAWGANGLSLSDAKWEITALGGSAGARVASIDDQALHSAGEPLADGLWFSIPGKGVYPISEHDHIAGTLTLVDTALPALATGDRGAIAVDGDGTLATYVELPSAVAAYGVRVDVVDYEDIPNVSNLVANADLSAWNLGLPVDWSKINGAEVVSDITDPAYARTAGHAARVQAAAAGHGIISDAFAIPAGDDARPYLGIAAGLTVAAGRVRLELRHSNGKVYPLDRQSGSEGLDIYLRLAAVPVLAEPLPAGTAQLALVAHGGGADFYLDTAMASPTVGEELGEFLPGDGARYLWADAVAELRRRARPRREYQLKAIDLHLADPDAFPFDRIDLGDDVTVRHPDLGNGTQRVVEIREDLLEPSVTEVVLAASARERLNDVLRPSLRRMGKQPNVGRPIVSKPALLAVSPSFDPVTNTLTLTALGNEVTASLELRTKTIAADPWPDAADEVINDRQGSLTPIEVLPETNIFYQVIGYDARGNASEPFESGYNREAGSAIYALANFRDIRRTATEVEFGWEWGAAVEEGVFWIAERVAGVNSDPWPASGDPPDIVIDAADPPSLVVPVPPAGSLTYVEARSRWNAAENLGPRWRGVITPAAGIILEYIDVEVDGTTVTVYTDEAGLSIKLERTDVAGWMQHFDVGPDRKLVFDVSQESEPGAADEMGVGESWPMRATVYGEPVVEVGVGTPEVSEEFIVSEATATPVVWVRTSVSAPDVGDDEVVITMHASDVPEGVEVELSVKEPGGDYGAYTRVDDTADFSPDPNGIGNIPDGVEKTYTFQSGYGARAKEGTNDVPTYLRFRFKVLDISGVVASETKTVSYYANAGV